MPRATRVAMSRYCVFICPLPARRPRRTVIANSSCRALLPRIGEPLRRSPLATCRSHPCSSFVTDARAALSIRSLHLRRLRPRIVSRCVIPSLCRQRFRNRLPRKCRSRIPVETLSTRRRCRDIDSTSSQPLQPSVFAQCSIWRPVREGKHTKSCAP
jgi:hypothetical protein